MDHITRVGLYERVSTEEQALYGYSIDAQKKNLEEFCQTKSMRIIGHYTDAGVSGGKEAFKRPAMARLLEDVQAGKLDMILFTKLDRWFRNVPEYFKVQEILDHNKVEWKAIHEDYDTTTSNGRFAITIFLAIAQNEREKGSERVAAVLQRKRMNKEACFGGDVPPFGYKRVRDENGAARLVFDPETEHIAREFWSLLLEGKSIKLAGWYLNDTYGLKRTYQEWRRTFNSPMHRGEWRGIKDFCPAYIETAVWERLKNERAKKRSPNRCYLFAGLIPCPECGAPLSSMTSLHKDYPAEYYSYRCMNVVDRRCSNHKYVTESLAQKWLLANVKEKLQAHILAIEAEDVAPKAKPKHDKNKINEKIRRLNVIYMNGEKSDAEYMAELAELKEQLAAADREAAEIKPRDLTPLREFLKLLTENFEEIYADMGREEKRNLWRSIIDHLVVEGNHVVDVVFKT